MKTGRLPLTAIVMAAAMVATAALADLAKPDRFLADARANVKIDPLVPAQFGDWKMQPVSAGIVNPQQRELLDTLYSEVISRTYVRGDGSRILLSIAYGRNQNDSLQVHTPELCYPAQGFQLKSAVAGTLATPYGTIPVRRLETTLGKQRPEPVTYWTTIGDETVRGMTDKKMKEMRYALQGYVADGLLFRVSSIDADSGRAFAQQADFVKDLVEALGPAERRRLAGLGN